MDIRVLIIDDDRAIRQMLERSFAADGYRVDSADTAEAGLAAVRALAPDVVVLDVGLPLMDGIEACRRIRREGHDVAIVLLTARGELDDRVAGLEAGADDYLPKPFAYEELLARVRALVRRSRRSPDTTVRFADVVLDPDARRARRGDRDLELSPREFDLLELLVRNARLVVDRITIVEEVWRDAIDVDSNALDVYVGYLRKKLEAAGEPRIIHTVRGVGFSVREASA
jgi:two-component system response regulator MprA